METIEITAGTVEQAIEKAEAQLGLSREQFKVEVVSEGRSGILGVGGKEAVIRVTPTTLPEEDAVNRRSHREIEFLHGPIQKVRLSLPVVRR